MMTCYMHICVFAKTKIAIYSCKLAYVFQYLVNHYGYQIIKRLIGGLDGGSRIRYSIKNCVLIRDSISEISP